MSNCEYGQLDGAQNQCMHEPEFKVVFVPAENRAMATELRSWDGLAKTVQLCTFCYYDVMRPSDGEVSEWVDAAGKL